MPTALWLGAARTLFHKGSKMRRTAGLIDGLHLADLGKSCNHIVKISRKEGAIDGTAVIALICRAQEARCDLLLQGRKLPSAERRL